MTNKALVCWEILWLETQGTSQLAYTWRCCARYPLTPFMQCWNGVEVQLCFLGWAVLQRLLGSWWFEMPGWSWDDFWEDQVTKPTKIKPSHVVCGWVGLLGMSWCISGGLLVVWCCFLEMHHPEISQNLSFFSFFLFSFFSQREGLGIQEAKFDAVLLLPHKTVLWPGLGHFQGDRQHGWCLAMS